MSSIVATHSSPERLPRQVGSALIAAGVIAVPLAALFWLSGWVSLPLALAAMVLFALVILSAGFTVLRLANVHELPVTAAWVVGAFTTALAIYLLVLSLSIHAAAGFAVWGACVAAVAVMARRRGAPTMMRETAGRALIALGLCAAATFMWCRDIAETPQLLARERILDAWIDHYIHGAVISYFGDPRALGRGSIDMAGFPMPLYHYVSYVLPAVFAAPLDLPGLPLSTSLWLPLGFFTMCCGAYALGAVLGGSAGGVAALAALTLVPDASNYGLRNGFFSFHWNVLTLPGALYTIGVYATAVALLHRSLSSGLGSRLFLSAALAVGTGLVRVHLFALGLPAWLAAVVSQRRIARKRPLAVIVAAIVAFALFVFGFYALTDSVPALELFAVNVHTLQEPTAYRGWYAKLLDESGRAVAVPLGVLAVFVAALGVFTIVHPIALILTARARSLTAADLVPVALVVAYLLLMITAPLSAHGDPTELTHRPFVLLYAIVAVWSAAALTEWAKERLRWPERKVFATAMSVSVLAALLVWPAAGLLARPKFMWGWHHLTLKLDVGLLESAAFLRSHSRPGDTFAVSDLRLGWVATDTATQLQSLTGIPAYLSRPFVRMTQGDAHAVEALRRYGSLARVRDAAGLDDALDQLRTLGVDWYVVADREERGPRWDPQRQHAVFVQGMVAVYAPRAAP
jgi:hypothetical protein